MKIDNSFKHARCKLPVLVPSQYIIHRSARSLRQLSVRFVEPHLLVNICSPEAIEFENSSRTAHFICCIFLDSCVVGTHSITCSVLTSLLEVHACYERAFKFLSPAIENSMDSRTLAEKCATCHGLTCISHGKVISFSRGNNLLSWYLYRQVISTPPPPILAKEGIGKLRMQTIVLNRNKLSSLASDVRV